MAALVPHVAALSDLFTTDRPTTFQDYGADPLKRAAYGLFFFPQTFARAGLPVDEAIRLRGWRPVQDDLRLLDLGAGTGGTLWGVVDVLRRLFPAVPVRAEAYDHSAGALEVLREAGEAAYPEVAVATQRLDLRDELALPDGRYDLISIGFALNELFAAAGDEEALGYLRVLLGRLRPGGLLLVVEPALQATATRLGRLRDRLADEGRAVGGPCLHAAACPMLARRTWCHEVRRWEPPASLEALNRRLHRDIDVVKFSYLLAGAAPLASVAAGAFRLVSAFTQEKGRLRATGCFDDGALREVEIQTRTLTKAETKALLAWERGDLARVTQAEPLADPARLRAAGPRGIERLASDA